MEIHFTKHAREKFRILARHGVKIPKKNVLETLKEPEHREYTRLPLLIVQRSLDENHVLRVVYREEEHVIIIVTFYPGRKSQYEKGQQY